MTSDLVDSEADGVHVLSVAAVAAAIFLHQSHQEAAGGLFVIRVVILLQQGDLILGVDPERVCRDAEAAVSCIVGHVVITMFNTVLTNPLLTGMVPAAAGGAPPPPAPFKRHSGPEAGGVLTEGVRCQITDLQPGELTQELLERHPDTPTRFTSPSCKPITLILPAPTYQNSPSSILQSMSSFSAESMAFHSEELTQRHSVTSCVCSDLAHKGSKRSTDLSLQAPVHSTWPQGFLIRIRRSCCPRCSTWTEDGLKGQRCDAPTVKVGARP